MCALGIKSPRTPEEASILWEEGVTSPLMWEVTSLQVSHPEIPDHGNKAKQGHQVEEPNGFPRMDFPAPEDPTASEGCSNPAEKGSQAFFQPINI